MPQVANDAIYISILIGCCSSKNTTHNFHLMFCGAPSHAAHIIHMYHDQYNETHICSYKYQKHPIKWTVRKNYSGERMMMVLWKNENGMNTTRKKKHRNATRRCFFFTISYMRTRKRVKKKEQRDTKKERNTHRVYICICDIIWLIIYLDGAYLHHVWHLFALASLTAKRMGMGRKGGGRGMICEQFMIIIVDLIVLVNDMLV